MGKFFHTNRVCFAHVFLTALILVTPDALWAGQKEGQVVPPLSVSSSEVINVLARQIAFVKTFSSDFSYQYEQRSGRNESRHARDNVTK